MLASPRPRRPCTLGSTGSRRLFCLSPDSSRRPANGQRPPMVQPAGQPPQLLATTDRCPCRRWPRGGAARPLTSHFSSYTSGS